MAAAGAWKIPYRGYRQGMQIPPEYPPDQRPRVRLATKAIQRRLIALECLDADPATLDGGWGSKTTTAVKAFQNASLLEADGWVYLKTAKALWTPLFVWWQTKLAIPDNLLAGQAYLESALDPGAEGDNPKGRAWYDRGIVQINRHFHPEISDEQAFGDVSFCIQWSGARLRDAYDMYGAWPPAVAYHNSPKLSADWARTGTAPNEQIRRYVELVYKAAGSTAGP
jgi:peptidoglycan hydrolase-like protein with peptidoglycan-binding domain